MNRFENVFVIFKDCFFCFTTVIGSRGSGSIPEYLTDPELLKAEIPYIPNLTPLELGRKEVLTDIIITVFQDW